MSANPAILDRPVSAGSHSAAAPQSFEVRPFANGIGAEIVGIDLGRDLNAEDFGRVHRAHLDYHVVVFRDQRITPQQHIDFSRRFGKLMIHVLHQFHLAGHPEILIISNVVENGQPIGLGDAGKEWHSDISYKELPALGSLLHAQELPSEGGDTLFADMELAYKTLPEHLRKVVEGRNAIHSYLARYDRLRGQSNWRPTLSAEQIVRESLKVAGEPGLILDVACGVGRFWPVLGEHANRVILATDQSQAILEHARTHHPQSLMKRVRTFQSSAFNIGLSENAVDSIFCMQLFQHIACPELRLAMLGEFYRVSRDTVIVAVRVGGCFMGWRTDRRGPAAGPLASKAQVEAEFKQVGLRVLSHRDFLPGCASRRVYVLGKVG